MNFSSINSNLTQISMQPKMMNSKSLTDRIALKDSVANQQNDPMKKIMATSSNDVKILENTNEKSSENLNSGYDFKNQVSSQYAVSKGSKIDMIA